MRQNVLEVRNSSRAPAGLRNGHEPILEGLIAQVGCKEIKQVRGVGGGCINQTFVFETDKGPFFVKVNEGIGRKMFDAEYVGLKSMHLTHSIRVPEPLLVGDLGSRGSFLIMEYIRSGHVSANTQKQLGYHLADMHLAPVIQAVEGYAAPSGRFGFYVDNTCGSTPQYNGWMDDWVEFWIERRLKPQLKWADERLGDRALRERGLALIDKLPSFFENVTVTPALLHGDLWSGNYAGGPDEEPVIFDPATYYGHSEAELSIMRMFGGFSEAFFAAYHNRIPKQPGFDQRHLVYQLYHYLNHLNLFGRGYYGSCMGILNSLT